MKMPTKNLYQIPKDVKFTILNIIKGHERRKREYKKEYDNIFDDSACSYETYIDDNGKTVIAFVPKGKGEKHSSVESKAQALIELQEKQDTIIMNIVDEELNNIGADISNLKARQQLIKGIYQNCISKEYPYERLYTPGISRKKFYQYRNIFIYKVAKKLNFL